MNNKLFRGFSLIFLISLVLSCSDFKDDGRISEGVIEYQVSYPKMDPNSILAEFLPNSMNLKFKNNKWHSELSAGFGMFRMNVINYGNDHQMTQMVKLINEKYVVKYNEAEALNSLKKFPKVSIKETGKTKLIAEFECKEAIVTISGDSTDVFKIYYTDQIHLDDPNWFTQFFEIKGVLMEYQVERYNLCTRFTAVEVLPQEIKDELFNVPEKYDIVEESEMTNKMEEIFNSFSE